MHAHPCQVTPPLESRNGLPRARPNRGQRSECWTVRQPRSRKIAIEYSRGQSADATASGVDGLQILLRPCGHEVSGDLSSTMQSRILNSIATSDFKRRVRRPRRRGFVDGRRHALEQCALYPSSTFSSSLRQRERAKEEGPAQLRADADGRHSPNSLQKRRARHQHPTVDVVVYKQSVDRPTQRAAECHHTSRRRKL